MFTTPGDKPLTTPPLTVAIVVLPLIHDPPLGEPLRVIVEPVHTREPPVIVAAAFTVTM